MLRWHKDIGNGVVDNDGIDHNPTLIDLLQTGNGPNYGGLASTIGTNHADDLTPMSLEMGIDGQPGEPDDHMRVQEVRTRGAGGHGRTTRRFRSVSRMVSEIGRCTKIRGSPNEITIERRRFSSISGPSTKPSRNGAVSQPSFTNT